MTIWWVYIWMGEMAIPWESKYFGSYMTQEDFTSCLIIVNPYMSENINDIYIEETLHNIVCLGYWNVVKLMGEQLGYVHHPCFRKLPQNIFWSVADLIGLPSMKLWYCSQWTNIQSCINISSWDDRYFVQTKMSTYLSFCGM